MKEVSLIQLPPSSNPVDRLNNVMPSFNPSELLMRYPLNLPSAISSFSDLKLHLPSNLGELFS